MTIDDFIKKHNFRSDAKRELGRPTMAEGWGEDARHWTVTLRVPKPENRNDWFTLKVPFTQGSAHTEPPTTNDVLDCLRSDFFSVIHGESFEDFCDEFGYDADSRKAEKIYRACQKSAEDFRTAFGVAILEELTEL
jgi:hypothetical protein